MPTRLKTPEPPRPTREALRPAGLAAAPATQTHGINRAPGTRPSRSPGVESRSLCWPGGEGRMTVLRARGGCPGAHHSLGSVGSRPDAQLFSDGGIQG